MKIEWVHSLSLVTLYVEIIIICHLSHKKITFVIYHVKKIINIIESEELHHVFLK